VAEKADRAASSMRRGRVIPGLFHLWRLKKIADPARTPGYIPDPAVLGRCQKCLILLGYLVGASGFEPETCSTQNCRATRLRYTPISGMASRYTLEAPAARHREGDQGVEKAPSGAPYYINEKLPAIRLRDGSRPPSCPWSRARSGPAHTGRGGVRSYRNGAGSPCGRRCPACPRHR
jgi:hypothetical protein